MAKLTLTDISSGFNSTTQLNANNTLIEAAVENTISRDGTTPNTMGVNFDMNNFKVINLAAPTLSSDAARLVDVQSAISGLPTASIIPNTPSGNIAAITVQGAINELDTEKAPLTSISLFPTVASATSPDIFGAAGATINYTGTTTATSFAACTAAQIGSTKTIIPVTGASFTASANLIIDGSTTATILQPAGAIVHVTPISTTKFKMTTILAEGTWTPVSYGTTSPGVMTPTEQLGTYTKIGNRVWYSGACGWSAHTGTGNLRISGFPFTAASGNENYGGARIIDYTGLTVSGIAAIQPVIGSVNASILNMVPGATASAVLVIDAAANLYFNFDAKVG